MSRAKLEDGLLTLGLPASDEVMGRLLAYRDLLLKWNKVYNLTALRDPAQVLSHHILDSLAIHPWVQGKHLLDVGSGGGLPGIPLAIVLPAMQVHSVDAVQKKVSFQRQAAIELGLSNFASEHARVENLSGQYDLIVSRAFSSLVDFTGLTRHLLAAHGTWLAMKGVVPDDEMQGLASGIQVTGVHRLSVPGLEAERHLITLKAVQ